MTLNAIAVDPMSRESGVAALDDFQAQAAPRHKFLTPSHQFARIAAVGPDAAQPAETRQKDRQDQSGSVAILDGCGMHDDMED